MEQITLSELANQVKALKTEMDELKINISKDKEFALRTEKVWQSYDGGEFISKSKNQFLKELEKC